MIRGWELTASEKETDDQYGNVTWAFGRDQWDSERAKGWFKLYYSPGYSTKIYYQTSNRLHFQSIKNRIATIGMRLTKSTIEDDGLQSVYIGKNYAVELKASTDSGDPVSVYSVNLYEKSTYLLKEAEVREQETAADEMFSNALSSSDQADYIYITQLHERFNNSPLRATPDPLSTEIYEISNTAKIYVLERGESYHKVRVDGRVGYLSVVRIQKQ